MSRTFLARASGLATLALLLGMAPAHAIDIEPPTITFTPAGDRWFPGSTPVTVAVADVGGGSVDSVEYQLTGAHDSGGLLGRSGGTIALTNGGVTEVVVTATDRSENTARSTVWFGIDRDYPTVGVTAPADGARVIQHSTVALSYDCADALSGIASCSDTTPSGSALDTSTLGTHTAQAMAVDRAGNTTTKTVAYEVVRGTFVLGVKSSMLGGFRVGETVTAVPPRTTPAASSYSYQWLMDGVDVPGATEATYAVRPTDSNKRISVRVTASRPGYDDLVSESSRILVGQASFSTSGPVISGDLVVGGTLAGSIEATPAPTAVFWTWRVDGTKVGDESSYEVRPEDVGKRVVLQAELWRPGYVSIWPHTEPSEPIRPATQDLQVVATVDGHPAVGQQLTAVLSGVPSGVQTALQWYADGAPISEATGTSHLLTAAQQGTSITVEVTVDRLGHVPWRTTSAPVGPVAAAPDAGPNPGGANDPAVVGTPTISGTAVAGQRLTAQLPPLPAGVTASYQWLADGAPIATGTGPTLLLGRGEVGRRVSLRASVTAPDRLPWHGTTEPTTAVAKARAVLRTKVRTPRDATRTATVTVRVSASGLAPTGRVTVRRKGKTLARAAVRSDGTARITLRRLKPGGQRLTVAYAGDPSTAAAQRALRFRIR
ncbi:Ig-like domain repeat protein [Nocardioides soli]|uniref:Bacterial Ig-like domain-containing protein n=1 Tax=Nocardioides soli TaxID=1036020 RepID=A0A7W4VXH2_9ACTN|nr:hypothetical protein [Nocardioides soli]